MRPEDFMVTESDKSSQVTSHISSKSKFSELFSVSVVMDCCSR
jgi:hypothetical protein